MAACATCCADELEAELQLSVERAHTNFCCDGYDDSLLSAWLEAPCHADGLADMGQPQPTSGAEQQQQQLTKSSSLVTSMVSCGSIMLCKPSRSPSPSSFELTELAKASHAALVAAAKSNQLAVSVFGQPSMPGAWAGCLLSPWCNCPQDHLGPCNHAATIPGVAAYAHTAGGTIDDGDVSGSLGVMPDLDDITTHVGRAESQGSGKHACSGSQLHDDSSSAVHEGRRHSSWPRPGAPCPEATQQQQQQQLQLQLRQQVVQQPAHCPVPHATHPVAGSTERVASFDSCMSSHVASVPYGGFPAPPPPRFLGCSSQFGPAMKTTKTGSTPAHPVQRVIIHKWPPNGRPGHRPAFSADQPRPATTRPASANLSGIMPWPQPNSTCTPAPTAPSDSAEAAMPPLPASSETQPNHDHHLRSRGAVSDYDCMPAAPDGTKDVPAPLTGRKRPGTGVSSMCGRLVPHPNGAACTACGALVTPVWRAGPAGPKTLCNACGVRYMKVARRK